MKKIIDYKLLNGSILIDYECNLNATWTDKNI